MKLSELAGVEVSGSGDKYLTQEELDAQNKKAAPVKLSALGSAPKSSMKLSQIGKAPDPSRDDNALEDQLTARKKQLAKEQEAAYAKETEIAKQEQIQNAPENWSSTRFKKEAPKPQTPEEQAMYDATLAKKELTEQQMTEKLLPPDLKKDKLEISASPTMGIPGTESIADFFRGSSELFTRFLGGQLRGASLGATDALPPNPITREPIPDEVLKKFPELKKLAVSQAIGEMTGFIVPAAIVGSGLGAAGVIDAAANAFGTGAILGAVRETSALIRENKNLSLPEIFKRVGDQAGTEALTFLAFEKGGEFAKRILPSLFKATETVVEPLQKITIFPEDIQAFFQAGGDATPVGQFLKSFGNLPEIFKAVRKTGKPYELIIPERIIKTIQDRPWFAGFKEAFNLEPAAPKTTVTVKGEKSFGPKEGAEPVNVKGPEPVKKPLKLSEIPQTAPEKTKLDAKIDTGSGNLKGAIQRIRGVLNKAGIEPGMVDALIKTGAKKEAVAQWIQGVDGGQTDDVFSVRFNEDLTALIDGKGVLEPSGEKPPVKAGKVAKKPSVEVEWISVYRSGSIDPKETRRGVIFTDSKERADRYGISKKYDIKFKNPYEADFNGNTWDEGNGDFNNIDDLVDYAKREGYDGVVALNVRGKPGDSFTTTEYAVFSEKNIKTAEEGKTPEKDEKIAKREEKTQEQKLAEEVAKRPFSELTIEADKVVGQMINEGIATKDIVKDQNGKIHAVTDKGKQILEDTKDVYKQFSQQVAKGARKPVKLSEVEKRVKELKNLGAEQAVPGGQMEKDYKKAKADFRKEQQTKARQPEASRTAEDFELHPDRMKDLKKGYVAMKYGGKVYAAKIGSTVKGVKIYNHADLGEAHSVDFFKMIPGFISKSGKFIEQYPKGNAEGITPGKKNPKTLYEIPEGSITHEEAKTLLWDYKEGEHPAQAVAREMRKEISEGQPGFKWVNQPDQAGTIEQTTAGYEPSTFPDYFKDKGYTKAEALKVIDAFLGNKPMTEKQRGLFKELFDAKIENARQEARRYAEDERKAKEEAEASGGSIKEIAQETTPTPSDQERPPVQELIPGTEKPTYKKQEFGAPKTLKEQSAEATPLEKSSSEEKQGNLFEKKKQKGTSAVGYPLPTEFPEEPGSPEAPISGNRPVRLERPAGVTGSVEAPEIITAMEELMKILGGEVPIRRGRFNQKALGIFKVMPEVVRLLTANDLPTALHETFHGIEKLVYGWSKGGAWKKPLVSPEIQKELMDLGKALYGSRKPAGGYKREGWAEFGRIWITDRAEAIAKAPKMTGWFENAFMKDLPDAAKQIQKIVGMLKTWNQMGSVARAKASMVDQGSVKREIKAAKTNLQNFASMEKWIDMLEPINRMAREAEEQLGRKLLPMEDPGFIATALRTTHDARTRVMVEEHMIDLAGNVVGPPLADIRAIVHGKKDEFSIYLWAKRAEALWMDKKNGPRNPGLSLEDARQIITELETPQFQLAAQKVYDWNESVLNYAAQGSPTFRVAVEKIRANSSGYYVPLQRVFEELDTHLSKMGGSGSKAMSGSLSKRLRGSGRQIKDIFPQMIANTRAMVKATHNRMVIDAMLKLSKVDGMGHLVEKVPKSKVPVQIKLDQVIRQLQKAGIEVEGMEPGEMSTQDPSGEMLTFFTEAQFPNGKDLIVPIFEGGKVVWYQFDPELYQALKSMEVYRLPQTGSMMDLVGRVFSTNARIFRTMTTGMRASFSLMTNWMRDLPTFLIQTKSHANPGQLLYSWLGKMGEGLVRATTGNALPWTDMFIRLGGEMAQPLGQDISHTRRAARRLFEGKITRVIDFRNWWDGIRDILQFPELATRTAELEVLAKEIGWRQGTPITIEQSLQLLTAIKQVTTDFSAGGEFAKTMNEIIPFFNAAIQGPRAGWRAYKRNPAGFIMKGLGTLTAIMLWNWWKNKDKEWRKELSPREKYMFTWFETNIGGRTELIKIPRPFELGQIFMSAPEALLDAWYEKDPQAVKDWFSVFMDASTPGLLPPIAQETIAQAANQDMFWKTPIVTKSMERNYEFEQFNEYTSKAAIFLGKLFSKKDENGKVLKEGISPQRIDHAIRGLTGSGSMDIIRVLGLGGKSSASEKEPADIPVAGVLFKRGGPLGTQPVSVGKLYDIQTDLGKRQASHESQETEREREMRLMINDATQAISALGFIRRKTDSVDEKRAITDQTLAIAKDALQNYRDNSINRFRFKLGRKRAQDQKKRIERYEAIA